MATFAMSYSLRWQLFLILVAMLRVLVRSAGLVSVLLMLVDVYLPGGLRFAAFACNANMLIRKCCLHELSLEFE